MGRPAKYASKEERREAKCVREADRRQRMSGHPDWVDAERQRDRDRYATKAKPALDPELRRLLRSAHPNSIIAKKYGLRGSGRALSSAARA